MRVRRSSSGIVRARWSVSAVALHVVRVHEQRLGELRGGAGELGEHEHAVAVRARGDELLRDEVHPVAQRRHEHRVGGSVEGDDLGLGQASVQVVDRRPARRRELAVDAADERVHLVAVLAVGLDVLARGDGHLHEPHALAQLGVARAAAPRTRAAGAGSPSCSRGGRRRRGAASPAARCACGDRADLRVLRRSRRAAPRRRPSGTPRAGPPGRARRSGPPRWLRRAAGAPPTRSGARTWRCGSRRGPRRAAPRGSARAAGASGRSPRRGTGCGGRTRSARRGRARGAAAARA